MNIDQVISGVLRAEGGYVNDFRDRGGETNYGVTVAVARANGWTGPMRDLPEAFARHVYRRRYADEPGFSAIGNISPAIGAELVDTGVNMGPGVPARFLQRALNGLNRGGQDYADLVVDGDCAQKTRAALTAFLRVRGAEGERRLLLLLNALQGSRYLDLCEGRVANEAFLFGWLARLAP